MKAPKAPASRQCRLEIVMRIRHECPAPDLSFLVTAPLHIGKGDGTVLAIKKWSLAGIWLEAPDPDLVGAVTLSIPFQGVDVSFPIQFAATDDPCHLVFKDLSVRQRETLAAFYKGVLAGRMVSTEDMITSLDTPVDLVPMGETEEEEESGKAKHSPRWIRTIFNVLIYGLLAALLVVFLGAQIWNRLTLIELEHGRFTAPVTMYKSPDAGYLKMVVKPGDEVAAGDIIARIEDPDRESDVEDVRMEVVLAERRLLAAQDRLERHIARGEPEAPRPVEQIAQCPAPGFEDVLTARPPDPPSNGAELRDYLEMLATLEAAVEDRSLELRRWKRDLRHRKAAADKLLIRARTAGTVTEVFADRGSYLPRNVDVVEIEDRRPRVAVAWLDDSLATHVHVGSRAEITYSYRGRTHETTGEVVEIHAGADARQPDRYGMILTIKADGLGTLNTRKFFRRNAPAKITVERPLPFLEAQDEGT